MFIDRLLIATAPVVPLLAQKSPSSTAPVGRPWTGSDSVSVLVLSAVLIAGVVILTAVVLVARGRLLAAKQQSATSMGIMESMRQLHEQGKMSKDEYDAVRRRMVARARNTDPLAADAVPDRSTSPAARPTLPTPTIPRPSTNAPQRANPAPAPGRPNGRSPGPPASA